MKKTLLTVMLAIATTFAMAQTYTDNLEVSIMGSKEAPQETTIVVNQASDGTYTLSLNNFILGGAIPVGNIVIDNIATTESNGIKSFEVVRNILITADGAHFHNDLRGAAAVQAAAVAGEEKFLFHLSPSQWRSLWGRWSGHPGSPAADCSPARSGLRGSPRRRHCGLHKSEESRPHSCG